MTEYELENPKWWVQRWNDLLNSYRFKKRLERGRKYAKEGNILSLDFAGSRVLAKVQGTAPEPYELSISIDPFSNEDWNYVTESMAEKAVYSAQLLAGGMPDNIEEVFTANGLSLFPFTLTDVHSRCSCPDPKNPCKHIAAVYYQLSDRFSEDPFVLFQLRGRTKTQILESLRQKRSQKAAQKAKQASRISPESESFSAKAKVSKASSKSSSSSNIPLDIENFWKYSEPLDSSLVVITPPPDSRTLLDVLGSFPLTETEDQALKQYLKSVYQTASQQAVMSALNRDS